MASSKGNVGEKERLVSTRKLAGRKEKRKRKWGRALQFGSGQRASRGHLYPARKAGARQLLGARLRNYDLLRDF
ncbi:hypothetical protein KCU92_g250, partial [Aureobasidium melanogenum]